ncbi:MAG: PhzF family phenazine biosynthesis protein [Sneathiella sp.]|nr:PhzF family phenazine biosynthesis protein [Sneathiella sp.]
MLKIHINNRIVNAQIVNGFVSGHGGGNPAGVVLDADDLDEADMLEIAQKIGLSETAFVSKSNTASFKLDFFTPNRRIAHCGHATIATFSYLAEKGLVSEGLTTKETIDGPRKIMIKDGAAYMEQLAPRYRSSSDWTAEGVTVEDVLKSLNLAPQDLDQRIDPVLVNTGNSFIVIAVKDERVLKGIQPDFEAITKISDRLDLIGYYIFTTKVGSGQIDATTRMFAPRYAIDEESATGMAAGPLACLLFDYLGFDKSKVVIGQGSFMKPSLPSLITVELMLKNGKITGLMAGGYGKLMKKVEIVI